MNLPKRKEKMRSETIQNRIFLENLFTNILQSLSSLAGAGQAYTGRQEKHTIRAS
jgi:hypothetical protein